MVHFLPWYPTIDTVALTLQFKRFANIYFLVIAILQTIPAISPLSPLTAWAPLIVVLGISMIREGNTSEIKATKIIKDTAVTLA